LAFHAKDALLVTDDFVATAAQGDRRLQSIAERLFRAAGNQQGRNRIGGGHLRTPQPPRGLVLATGEDVPVGQSIRARLLIVEAGAGEVNRTTLTECQKAAQRGQLAASLRSFLLWMAGQYDSVRERLRGRVEQLRSEGRGRAIHARLPAAVAELQAGFEIFLEFAWERGGRCCWCAAHWKASHGKYSA
jgi:hypothetical protein